ncbi:tail fiber assembly protein [Pseudomonas sp. B21-040]|uniref:tail fiber assembly protein n=1 Tax=Pseudomonas sp. B21-040 TaxID=2895486 RepID=UPI00216049A4|nr:tail fiber assembly protein [Pseudomonas sp. B21-040]UVL42383.1 tail fiber assembly protein [Pseudomonas sp. B21-040]
MITYLIDDAGALSGPVTFPDIPGFGPQLPGNAVQVPKALAPPEPGKTWALIDDATQQLLDLRGTVFRTTDGLEQSWQLLGELPEGLTTQPWPGEHFKWINEQWNLDDSAQLAAQSAQALDHRDNLLRDAQLRIAPLQYAEKLGTATPEEQASLLNWMRYSVELNRIEQQTDFPNTIVWPTQPQQQHR